VSHRPDTHARPQRHSIQPNCSSRSKGMVKEGGMLQVVRLDVLPTRHQRIAGLSRIETGQGTDSEGTEGVAEKTRGRPTWQEQQGRTASYCLPALR
jgi:hypothetical protein